MRVPTRLCVAFLGGVVASACTADDGLSDLATDQPVLLVAEPDLTLPTAAQPGVRLTDAAGQPLAPVHAHLMPDGRVLMIGVEGNAGVLTPSPGNQLPPAAVQLAPATASVELTPGSVFAPYAVADSLFCSGHTALADGSFLSVGGTRFLSHQGTGDFAVLGLDYATRFDGTSWTRADQRMVVPGGSAIAARWYPQATRLADGKVLVTSGYDLPFYGQGGQLTGVGTSNVSAELYDPATATFTAVSDPTTTPRAIFNPDYTHAFVLPYQHAIDVLAFGESSAPVYWGRDLPGGWYVRALGRPGNVMRPDGIAPGTPNYGASSVMLPIRLANSAWGYFNGAVLFAGGAYQSANEHSIDVFDPIADAWLPRRDLDSRRHHPSTVLLPDGRIAILAGHDDQAPTATRVRHAVYADPAAGLALTEGTSALGESRGYHTVTLLLPDGRVLIGGGRSAGAGGPVDERADLRYLYPSYMFRPRPNLTAAPAALGYGAAATVGFQGAPTEAVLIGLGSMTHSFDSNQRYVQLGFTRTGPTTGTVLGPPNPETAPPGYYMLFLLDATRAPSLARIVAVR